jgi:lipopolysaccharide transport system ATP-binding protein
MRVRLGFSVAAHLEPEILIIDEVLAVGDMSFQKKCLGKMGEVARSGRTVLFVSHNMAAVQTFCTRGILLKDGVVERMGGVGAVVGEYLQAAITGSSERSWPSVETAPGNEIIRLLQVRVRPPDQAPAITIDTGAIIEVAFYCGKPRLNLDCTVYLVNQEGIMLFESGCDVSASEDSRVGIYRVSGSIPSHLLNAGRYYLNVVFGQDQKFVLFKSDEVVAFEVENTATGRGFNMAVAPGVVRPILKWQCEYSNHAPDCVSPATTLATSK